MNDAPTTSGCDPARPTYLVTGSAGTLGQAIVQAFADRDWHVLAGWHTTPPVWALPQVSPVALDISSAQAVERAYTEVATRYDRLDGIVHAAGIARDIGIARMTVEDWDQVLKVNLTGTLRCTRAFLPLLQKSGGGHIVHLGSFSAKTGRSGQTNYTTAKAALAGMTEALAAELGPDNIRVNTVLPGFIESAMTQHLHADSVEQQRARHVLGRFTTVQEIARFLVFLVESQHISGQTFQLDSRLTAVISP